MNFIMSYSCGKDSTLALHKMLQEGHTPLGLMVMFNEQADRSFFHGAQLPLLERYSRCLGIPLLVTPTQGDVYHLRMEETLRRAKDLGAEAVCFGDLDLEANRQWSQDRCDHVGLKAVFPLWHHGRRDNVYELLDLGYRCLVKSIHNTQLPRSILGKFLEPDTLALMDRCGIDLCGENGEYHTLVVDGPIFRQPLPYETGEVLDFGEYSVIDVR